MTFGYGDKNDKRIIEASPYALDYPADVDKAPEKAGVYMFIDKDGEVIYVGKASGGRLRDEIRGKEIRVPAGVQRTIVGSVLTVMKSQKTLKRTG